MASRQLTTAIKIPDRVKPEGRKVSTIMLWSPDYGPWGAKAPGLA
jgi:hypothetical protein